MAALYVRVYHRLSALQRYPVNAGAAVWQLRVQEFCVNKFRRTQVQP